MRRALEGAHGSLLGAVLEHHSMSVHRFHQRTALLHGVGDRFFQIDILAGTDRRQGEQRMPMVWRGDRDSVDVRTREQFAEVMIGGAGILALRGIGVRLGLFHLRAVDIAYGDQTGFRQSGPSPCVAGTLSAGANHPDVQPGGRWGTGGAQPRWKDQGDGGGEFA